MMALSYRLRVASFVLTCHVILTLNSCRHQASTIARSVYYWKTSLSIDTADYKHLDSLGVRKIYLRFFDVDFSPETKLPIPISAVAFSKPMPSSVSCVPVVFVRNTVFEKMTKDSVNALAKHMFNLVDRMCKANRINYKEMQLDCDWTLTTKDKYFKLVSIVHDSCKANGIQLSATIRLHQVKYMEKTGVPNVDRGMLMFYNMGKLEDTLTHNSIFDAATALRYTSNIKNYPLPLDVVLPMFSWGVHMRNGHVIGLADIDQNVLRDTLNFVHDKGSHYTAKRDFDYKVLTFKRGDKIRYENCGVAECSEAAELVRRYLKHEDRTVSIFDFQPDNFSQHAQGITRIYQQFE